MNRMVCICAFILIAISLLCINVMDGTTDNALLISWSELSSQIREKRLDNFTHDELLRVDAYRQLSSQRDYRAYVEMIDFSGDALVEIAGFQLIRTHYPKQGLSSAFRVLLRTSIPGSMLYKEIESYVKEDWTVTELNEAFSQLELAGCQQVKHVLFLVAFISSDSLRDWFHYSKRRVLSPTHEAIVLERLFNLYRHEGIPPSNEMKRALRMSSKHAGYPCYVYLQFGDESDREFSNLLIRFLRMEDVDSVLLRCIVDLRKDFIRRRVRLDDLAVSPERRDWLEKRLHVDKVKP